MSQQTIVAETPQGGLTCLAALPMGSDSVPVPAATQEGQGERVEDGRAVNKGCDPPIAAVRIDGEAAWASASTRTAL